MRYSKALVFVLFITFTSTANAIKTPVTYKQFYSGIDFLIESAGLVKNYILQAQSINNSASNFYETVSIPSSAKDEIAEAFRRYRDVYNKLPANFYDDYLSDLDVDSWKSPKKQEQYNKIKKAFIETIYIINSKRYNGFLDAIPLQDETYQHFNSYMLTGNNSSLVLLLKSVHNFIVEEAKLTMRGFDSTLPASDEQGKEVVNEVWILIMEERKNPIGKRPMMYSNSSLKGWLKTKVAWTTLNYIRNNNKLNNYKNTGIYVPVQSMDDSLVELHNQSSDKRAEFNEFIQCTKMIAAHLDYISPKSKQNHNDLINNIMNDGPITYSGILGLIGSGYRGAEISRMFRAPPKTINNKVSKLRAAIKSGCDAPETLEFKTWLQTINYF